MDFTRGSPRVVGELADKVLLINRIAKKIKGGDKISFAAQVAVGDHRGRVGLGYGKAADVKSAIGKATVSAKKKIFNVPLKDSTIPRRILVKEGAARVLLMPAPRGAGLIAGGAVRDILELAGVADVSSKILGTDNPMTNAQAVIKALKALGQE